jgi:hypothetical protein
VAAVLGHDADVPVDVPLGGPLDVRVEGEPAAALRLARALTPADQLIVVTGSLHLLGVLLPAPGASA